MKEKQQRKAGNTMAGPGPESGGPSLPACAWCLPSLHTSCRPSGLSEPQGPPPWHLPCQSPSQQGSNIVIKLERRMWLKSGLSHLTACSQWHHFINDVRTAGSREHLPHPVRLWITSRDSHNHPQGRSPNFCSEESAAQRHSMTLGFPDKAEG